MYIGTNVRDHTISITVTTAVHRYANVLGVKIQNCLLT